MRISYTYLTRLKLDKKRRMRIGNVKCVFDNSKFSREFPIYRCKTNSINYIVKNVSFINKASNKVVLNRVKNIINTINSIINDLIISKIS